MRAHVYRASLRWIGNRGQGTSSYTAFGRDLEASVTGRAVVPPLLPMSSDPAFRGDPTRHSPEDLLLLSLSSCHMLWYLHLASEHGIRVEDYVDECEAVMADEGRAGGQFLSAVLRPRLRLSAGDPALALSLHDEAHKLCFIARSVNFPVTCEPVVDPGT